MRLGYRAGDRLFVDYSGDRMPVVSPERGEVWRAEIFVAVLGASGYLYVEATRGQELQSWLGAHANAFEFYAGVPAVVVPDYVARHIIRVLCPTELCGRSTSSRRICGDESPDAAGFGHITVRAKRASSAEIRPTFGVRKCIRLWVSRGRRRSADIEYGRRSARRSLLVT